MRLAEIVNGPWAITPEMLGEIRSIYAKHLRGEKINLRDVEAQTGRQLKNRPQGYDLINSAAVVPVHGVIAKRMNMLINISGGASTQLVERDIKKAQKDENVEKIILYIDSPGGTVDGIFELSDFIYEAREKKPIIAYTDGMMTSAAYAIGSAASAIYISGDTTVVGNIGVVTAHEDVSKLEEKIGIKTTEIYSGKYKRIASEYAPLTDEGRQTIQDRIDYYYTVFINTVARNRGVSPETVLGTMSTDVKDMHIGRQALEAGLVDGVSTLHRLVCGDSDQQPDKSDGILTLAELKQRRPDLIKSIHEECNAELFEKHRKEGAAAERARMRGIWELRKQSPGHESMIESFLYDGVTTAGQVAMKIIAVEKRCRGLQRV